MFFDNGSKSGETSSVQLKEEDFNSARTRRCVFACGSDVSSSRIDGDDPHRYKPVAPLSDSCSNFGKNSDTVDPGKVEL